MDQFFTGVHSHWSAPAPRPSNWYIRLWALTACLLKLRHGRTRLVTDSTGAAIADRLDLPYTSVTLELDLLSADWGHIWAMGKLRAYHAMTAPFLHYDLDVISDQDLTDHIGYPRIVAERPEGVMMNVDFLDRMEEPIPLTWMAAIYLRRHPDWNAGLIGGWDIETMQRYTTEALRLTAMWMTNNRAAVLRENGGEISRFVEQWSFGRYWSEGEIVSVYPEGMPSEERITQVGHRHLQGDLKSSPRWITYVRERLAVEFPQLDQRVADYLRSR